MTERGSSSPRAWISGNVLALGLVSLLTDTASEMVVPLLPAFLTGVLGASALALGWIEGAAEALASALKLAGGRWSDRLGRRRAFVVFGYTLASVARPLMGAATLPWHVLAVRLVDRTGKGLRTSPRDALISASVPLSQHGSAFGFHRAMDHLGAALGPLFALGILVITANNLRAVFWLSAVPGALAVLVLLLKVREKAVSEPTIARGLRAPPKKLLRFLLPLGLFALGNASDLFLLLKAGAVHTPLAGLPLLWMAFHVVKSASSVAGGRLSDRIGPLAGIRIAWVVYILAYVGLAQAESVTLVTALFLGYGIHHGLAEAPEKALVAKLSEESERATAFGWYHLTVGLLVLPASVLFGWLWDAFGSHVAFLTSAALATAALLVLPSQRRLSGP